MKIIVCTALADSLRLFRLDFMVHLVGLGHEVLALAGDPENENAEFFESYGIRYREFFVERNGTNPAEDLKTVANLVHIFKQEKPDKICLYHAKSNIYGSIAAKISGVSDVYPMVGGIGSVFSGTGLKGCILKAVLTNEYRLSMRWATRVFFQNNDDVCLFKQLGIIQKRQVALIHGSGVNTNRFYYSTPACKPSFILIARLIKDKGVREYLEAARIIKRRHSKAEFRIVGAYDSNPTAVSPDELKEYIDDGTIIYEGEADDVRQFLLKASIFVLPSYREGTPRSALEAMSMGRPIIVTDVPGCREVIRDGINGFAVEAKNVDSLANAMERFITNPEIITSMGKAGRNIALELFDVQAVNKSICRVLFASGANIS